MQATLNLAGAGPHGGDLLAVIRSVYASRQSGVLHVFLNGTANRLYFDEGAIVFAGSDIEEDRLGATLVRAGEITRAQLEQALEAMPGSGRTLAATLVDMRLISKPAVQRHAVERMLGIVFSLYGVESHDCRFDEGESRVAADMAIDVPTSEILLDASRRIDGESIRELIGDRDAVVQRAASGPYAGWEEKLHVTERAILSLSEKSVSIRELMARSRLREDEALTCVGVLLAVGLIERVESPPARETGEETVETAPATTPESTTGSVLAGLEPPDRLGRYEIQNVVGRGSMGTVLLGRDPAIERVVA